MLRLFDARVNKTIDTAAANRNAEFVKGFFYRIMGEFDRAERYLRDAWELSTPGNYHVLRELSYVLLAQEEYEEAKEYAEMAYSVAPTNPYVIDMMLQVLFGSGEWASDEKRVDELMDELSSVKEREQVSFFETRKAEQSALRGDFPEAIKWVERAIVKTPDSYSPYVMRAKIRRMFGDDKVAEDLKELDRLHKARRGGSTREIEMWRDVLRVRQAIGRGRLDKARQVLAKSRFIPSRLSEKLQEELRNRE